MTDARRGDIACQAVQIDTKTKNARPIVDSELRRETGKDSGKDIASPASRHAGISRRVDVCMSRGRRKNRMKPFEYYVRAPASRRFERDFQSPRLHFFHRDAEQARHFAGMRRDRQRWSAPLVEMIGHAVISVQSVSIQDDRKFRLGDQRTNELLSLMLHGKPGTDRDDRLTARDFRESSVIEIAEARRARFGRRKRHGHHFRH